MRTKRNLDNDQVIFHAFTDAEVNKNFNVLYEEFEYSFSSVRGFTSNPISYLMRKNLITKDEANYPEAEYVTLDQKSSKGLRFLIVNGIREVLTVMIMT